MSSDSHVTITYTSMSSYEVIVNGYYGMPMDPLDPYLQLPETPPSPDYIPGPEYPEYLPPADNVLLVEEQPIPTAVSPTAESPGYITESKPEMEPEEEDGDDEKYEEDTIDYPTSGGDNNADDDGDDLSEDDVDDEEEEESSDSEEDEEEHLALTVPAPALYSSVSASDETEPIEEGDTVATPPPFGYRVAARISVQPHILMPFRSKSEFERLLAIPTPPLSPAPPSPDYIPGPEAPPSPDYIPGPEAPPSLDYIPGPEYPEYLPPADDVLPAEEQPLPAAVSRTSESPGYITKSEPEMEPEDEDGDDEKSDEDSIEYPTSGEDDDADDDGDDFPFSPQLSGTASGHFLATCRRPPAASSPLSTPPIHHHLVSTNTTATTTPLSPLPSPRPSPVGSTPFHHHATTIVVHHLHHYHHDRRHPPTPQQHHHLSTDTTATPPSLPPAITTMTTASTSSSRHTPPPPRHTAITSVTTKGAFGCYVNTNQVRLDLG
nr:hypothetical protein [Tanacetum cinerariifolium]